MTIKRGFVCCAVAFSVVLAIIVGNRMSAEAMAVVIGVVCGVTASIPMSAVILALSRRSRLADPGEMAAKSPAPLVIMTPPGVPAPRQPANWPAYCQPLAMEATPMPREFRVIGDERLI